MWRNSEFAECEIWHYRLSYELSTQGQVQLLLMLPTGFGKCKHTLTSFIVQALPAPFQAKLKFLNFLLWVIVKNVPRLLPPLPQLPNPPLPCPNLYARHFCNLGYHFSITNCPSECDRQKQPHFLPFWRILPDTR
jgi:hypothetical protein